MARPAKVLLLNRISLTESPETGAKHRSDLLITLPNIKRLRMIIYKMVFTYQKNSQKFVCSNSTWEGPHFHCDVSPTV